MTGALIRVWCACTFGLGPYFFMHAADSIDSSHQTASEQQTRTVSELPIRLEPITLKADWGIDQPRQVTVRLVNQTGMPWTNVSADGGCSCVQLRVEPIPASGIAAGDPLVASLAYARPQQPGVAPRTLKFVIEGATVMLPILVDWQSPVVIKQVRQIDDQSWDLRGTCRQRWSLDSIEVMDDEVQLTSTEITTPAFQLGLSSSSQIVRNVRLVLHVSSPQSGASLAQLVHVRLESDRPRSVPSCLVCRLGADGAFSGDTRLVFPRSRLAGCPQLLRCDLIAAGRAPTSLSFRQNQLGKIAIWVHFQNDSPIAEDAMAESSRIRFSFDDGSRLDCPFLVSKGQ